MSLPAVYETSFPAPQQMQELFDVLQENLQFEFQFERIPWPTGGVTSFTVIDETGQEAQVKELVGVILHYTPMNVYYGDEGYGERRAPVCVSYDGKTSTTGVDCLTCPRNKFPEEGGAKPCKNLYRVFFLRDGEVLPVLISIPPTSRRAFERYLVALAQKVKRYNSVVTRLSLTKQKNKKGIEYAQAVFSYAGDLAPEQAEFCKKYAEFLKPRFASVAVTIEDYYSNGDSSEEVPF